MTLGLRADEAREFTSEAYLRYYLVLLDGQPLTITDPKVAGGRRFK